MLSFGNSEVDFPGGLPVEGKLLAEVLSSGRLAPDAAFRYALDIGAAIDKAHFRGMVHGSLSPYSIAITQAGARVLLPRPADSRAAAYRAPEQVRGESPDARSDVFAYGAIIYELASGKRAFPMQGEALDQALLLEQPAPIPPTSPLREAMGEVIESCLHKEVLARRQRIQNAVVELKLNGGAFRRATVAARPAAAPRAAVIAFPQAVPPPLPSLPIHAVPAAPRLENLLAVEPPLPVARAPRWQGLANAPAARGYDWRFWAAGAVALALFVQLRWARSDTFAAAPEASGNQRGLLIHDRSAPPPFDVTAVVGVGAIPNRNELDGTIDSAWRILHG